MGWYISDHRELLPVSINKYLILKTIKILKTRFLQKLKLLSKMNCLMCKKLLLFLYIYKVVTILILTIVAHNQIFQQSSSEFQVILSVSLYLCEVYRRGTNVFQWYKIGILNLDSEWEYFMKLLYPYKIVLTWLSIFLQWCHMW